MESNNVQPEPIAIIGIGCRFPGGCDSPSKLWDLLKQPKDVQRRIPEERFNAKSFYNENGLYHGNSNVLHAYTLSEDVRSFDAQFFGINAVEASAMDPQQRLLLETVYEAVESAGLKISKLQGTNVGVYVGLMCNDYESMLLRDLDTMPTYHATGIGRSIMSNRISYFFDWTGPSMTIDTACSSSLIALHEAVQLLRQGRTKVAVAAGTNLILGPENFIGESKLKMLSPTGRSRMWDADGDGYARGEGVAAVILKPLSAAIADGDTIECIVRETGTNQDGRSKGITHPSSTAQANLIREVYRSAGLDPMNPRDRPHFFEAHGTGTPAGDPIEAAAIASAFFPNEGEVQPSSRLYCGSVKTVLGHTEGTAGLAAVIKAALALKHAQIPPNLHFNTLNPSLEPVYRYLQVPTELHEWPVSADGSPRRASVNSFGFGGANAHAILESFHADGQACEQTNKAPVRTRVAPFVFSAASESSLRELLRRYAAHLRQTPEENLQALAFTLDQKRTCHPYRKALTAQTADILSDRLEEAALGASLPPNSRRSASPAILGIFTGQGAQWPAMGQRLITQSPKARSTLEYLQRVLSELPDAPQWRLVDEILAEGSKSRIREAEISQPACTAVQIMLVDLLKSGGVKLKAVVGHSSGEMAAAYFAGYISAECAIITAYYRGKHARLAQGQHGEKGTMMAVSTTSEDAQELCQLPDFRGHICLAACNSPTSVTMSGDMQAIKHAQIVFEDEEKMAKMLFVDKAYHSHHMLRCSEAYRTSLKNSGSIFCQPSDPGCEWVSSVYNKPASQISHYLTPEYWNKNMVQPVLFSQAVETAYSLAGPFDLAVEIGPHPALKRPTIETYQAVHGSSIPYVSLLQRHRDDISVFSDGLGQLWELCGDAVVDLTKIQDSAFFQSPKHRMLDNIPSYPWSHDRRYWHESRISRNLRNRPFPTHELLGNLLPDGTEHILRWRNYMSVREIPWLEGHRLQEQTVFPAAGYISMAVEATKILSPHHPHKLLEVRELKIHQAMSFHDDSDVETLFTLFDITYFGNATVTASFSIESTVGKNATKLTATASGSILLELGEPAEGLLPPKADAEANLIAVPTERFYDSLLDVGYNYTGAFKGLSGLSRNNGHAQGLISNQPSSHDAGRCLIIHPATLDLAIQAVILAHSYPYDGQMFAIHVPVEIACVRLNMGLCKPVLSKEGDVPFTASTYRNNESICGDVDMYPTDGRRNAMIQVEGIKCVLFSEATEKDDAQMFSTTEWGSAVPCGPAVCFDGRASACEYSLALDLERACYYYLREWAKLVPEDTMGWMTEYQGMYRFMCHIRSKVQRGQHVYAKLEWETDTAETLSHLRKKHSNSLDFKIIDVVGTVLPAVLRNETTILEHLMQDNLLNDYYSNALGFPSYTTYLARMVAQLVHRYPHMRILEIGAGTGGATKGIFKQIGSKYAEYTFTDISSGFFDKAQEVFQSESANMKFAVLDIEQNPSDQGFEIGAYDLVVASFVLHATKQLRRTLRNVRQLLKPGGFLLMLEMTDNEPMRTGFIFGALPQWWSGADDGRVLSPCVEPLEWHRLLRETGFSGIDTITADQDRLPHPASVILSQAVDNMVTTLREPMINLDEKMFEPVKSLDLVILGGNKLKTCVMADNIAQRLSARFSSVTSVPTLQSVQPVTIGKSTVVLSILDLDLPVFRDMDDVKFHRLKHIFENSYGIAWYTRGSRADDPYANMIRGFGRSLLWELPELRLQFLDFENTDEDATAITHTMLHFCLASKMQDRGSLKGALWSIEPEVVIQGDKTLIPRIKPNSDQNARFNSTRRNIQISLDPSRQCLEAKNDGGAFFLEQKHLFMTNIPSGFTLVDVRYSSALALSVHNGLTGYLVFGKVAGSLEYVLGLSQANASKVVLHHESHISVPDIGDTLFSNICLSIVAQRILAQAVAGSTLLVLSSNDRLAFFIQQASLATDVKCVCTTPDLSKQTDGFWRVIHPLSRTELVRESVPPETSIFLDCSKDEPEKRASRAIRACLPRGCEVYDVDQLYANTSSAFQHVVGRSPVKPFLTKALDFAQTICLSDKKLAEPPPISIAELSRLSSENCKDSHLFWHVAKGQCCSAVVRSFDTESLFRSDRTYWLVGLTGDLGLSLCAYMHDHGAKYLVLSSRNPNIDQRWLAKMRKRGAVLNIVSCDVTDFESLSEAHRTICQTLPPVAGVVQGAMVLHDTPVRDMTFEMLQKVLRPKVQGSINLNRIFNKPDLDFFIYFSSMTGVVGNIGQANYTTANAFMMSQAAQRRKHGLAGSVINIGAIIGVGYVTRELSQASQDNLIKGGYIFMSENAFHQAFSEAVVAGMPGSKSDPEISTGLRQVHRADQNLPVWIDNPRFAHHVVPNDDANDDNAAAGDGLSINEKLQLCTTAADLETVIFDAFASKLSSLLRMELNVAEGRVDMMAKRTDDFGIDSLVAVEIRTWFLKTLGVNVPVLKILGGAAVEEIIEFVAARIDPSMTPNMGKEASKLPSISQAAVSVSKAGPEVKASLTVSRGTAQDNSQGPDAASNMMLQAPSGSDDLTAQRDTTLSTGAVTPPDGPPQVCSSHTISSSEDEYIETPETGPSSDQASVGVSTEEFVMVEDVGPKPLNAPEGLFPEKEVRKGPLSYSQEMFFFVHHFNNNRTTLNHTGSFRVIGSIDTEKLKYAVEAIGARHESLRTKYMYTDSKESVQIVLKQSPLHLEVYEVHESRDVDRWFKMLTSYEYRIECGETIRVALLRYSGQSFLLLGCHHINVDGLSFKVLLSDLERAYRHETFSHPAKQYLDYANDERLLYSRGALKSDLSYWRSEFHTIPPVLPILSLPGAKQRIDLVNYSFSRAKIHLDASSVASIRAVCKQVRATPFHFHLFILQALLSRFIDEEEVCIGLCDANRTSDESMTGVGAYVNLVPVRLPLNRKADFVETLLETKRKVLTSLSHAQVPFGLLLSELNVPRSNASTPLFQAFVDYRLGHKKHERFADCQLELLEFEQGRTAYDINLDILESEADCTIDLMLQESLYTEEDAHIFAHAYQALVDAFTKNTKQTLDQPTIHTPSMISEAIRLGTGPCLRSKWPPSIFERIQDICSRFPHNVAITDGSNASMTYSQLATRVNSIAHTLLTSNIGPGSRCGVFQHPKADWVCSLLAIWSVGGVYVPLDLSMTVPRLAQLVQDCQPSVILTSKDTLEALDEVVGGETLTVNVDNVPTSWNQPVGHRSTPDATCAIFYTSGSTGTPKGISLINRNICNEIEFSGKSYGIGRERVLQQSSLGFDMSLTQIFSALAFGGSLHMVPLDARGDPRAIVNLMVKERITMTGGTPSEYQSWIQFAQLRTAGALAPWRIAVSGGEQVGRSLLDSFRSLGNSGLRLFNAYGPTEATCSSNRIELDYRTHESAYGGSRIPAGHAAPNAAVYILDDHGRALPVGMSGEVSIGGAGVASGYINHDCLTRERFVKNQYMPTFFEENGWTTMHKTGDRGHLLPDGSLVIEGRIDGDTQVKLSGGLRIDLLEIEHSIIRNSDGGVREAVVCLLRESEGPETLALQGVCAPEIPASVRREYLRKLVMDLPFPQYMKPTVAEAVEHIPKTSSGKVDRKAVSKLSTSPAVSDADDAQIPLSSEQSELLDIWTSVLPQRSLEGRIINPSTDFFHIGGTSMLLITLRHRIQETCGVELALVDMFKASTLADMALLIEEHSRHSSQAMIDWKDEIALPDLDQLHSIEDSARSPPQSIILTGATGFLGRKLLELLIADPRVKAIHCIAVRQPNKLTDVLSHGKLKVYSGDLTSPSFGLSPQDATHIFSTADAIIHNGADVSHLKVYDTLKQANTTSTLHLLHLCATHNRIIPIHFLSTAGVSLWSRLPVFGEHSAAHWAPPTNGFDGYTASKWASERLLEQACARYRVPVTIHRPSNIQRDGAAPDMDLFQNLLRYCRELNAVPRSPNLTGTLNLVSVSACAAMVLDAVFAVPSAAQVPRYVNEIGHVDLDLEDLGAFVESSAEARGVPVESIALGDWIARAEGAGLNPAVAAFFRRVERDAESSVRYPRLVKGAGEVSAS